MCGMCRAARTATLIGHTHDVKCTVFSPDGTTLATGAWDATVRLWDVRTAKLTATFTGHTDSIADVGVCPDGTTIVCGHRRGTISLWDVQTHTCTAVLGGNADYTENAALSPDGTLLAMAQDVSGVSLWTIPAGTHKATLTSPKHTVAVNKVVFSLDGKTLASSNDTTVSLWDIPSQTQKATFPGNLERIDHLAFSPDGKRSRVPVTMGTSISGIAPRQR